MKKLGKIGIKRIVDNNPDLDYLGVYSDAPATFSIETEEYTSGQRGVLRYFNADSVESMEEAQQNYRRIQQYEKGELVDYGIKAEAEILVKVASDAWLSNTVTSGGLWSVPSDSDEPAFKDFEDAELEELRNILIEFGFTLAEIDEAMPKAKE